MSFKMYSNVMNVNQSDLPKHSVSLTCPVSCLQTFCNLGTCGGFPCTTLCSFRHPLQRMQMGRSVKQNQSLDSEGPSKRKCHPPGLNTQVRLRSVQTFYNILEGRLNSEAKTWLKTKSCCPIWAFNHCPDLSQAVIAALVLT